MLRRKMSERLGQASVELAVMLPVVIAIAVIAVNACTFLGACASFDRVARQAICTYGASPSSGQSASDIANLVAADVESVVGADNVNVGVQASGQQLGLTRYTARLEYAPTLFGMGLRSEIFGVRLPRLSHEVNLVVDTYRPGVLF